MNSNFERLHKIIIEAYAENFSISGSEQSIEGSRVPSRV
jgi:hypothetical protein